MMILSKSLTSCFLAKSDQLRENDVFKLNAHLWRTLLRLTISQVEQEHPSTASKDLDVDQIFEVAPSADSGLFSLSQGVMRRSALVVEPTPCCGSLLE